MMHSTHENDNQLITLSSIAAAETQDSVSDRQIGMNCHIIIALLLSDELVVRPQLNG